MGKKGFSKNNEVNKNGQARHGDRLSWALEPYPNWKLERPTSGGIGTGQALPR
jgi:hypothetical protein